MRRNGNKLRLHIHVQFSRVFAEYNAIDENIENAHAETGKT